MKSTLEGSWSTLTSKIAVRSRCERRERRAADQIILDRSPRPTPTFHCTDNYDHTLTNYTYAHHNRVVLPQLMIRRFISAAGPSARLACPSSTSTIKTQLSKQSPWHLVRPNTIRTTHLRKIPNQNPRAQSSPP